MQSQTKDNIVCPTGGFPSSLQGAGNPPLPPSLGQGSHSRGIFCACVSGKNLFPIGVEGLCMVLLFHTEHSQPCTGRASQGVSHCSTTSRAVPGLDYPVWPDPSLWKGFIHQHHDLRLLTQPALPVAPHLLPGAAGDGDGQIKWFSPCFVSFEKLRFPTSSASRSLGRAKAAHVQSFLPAFLNLKFQRTLQCANE